MEILQLACIFLYSVIGWGMKTLIAITLLAASTLFANDDCYETAAAIRWLDYDLQREAWQARQDYQNDAYWAWIAEQQERRQQKLDRFRDELLDY